MCCDSKNKVLVDGRFLLRSCRLAVGVVGVVGTFSLPVACVIPHADSCTIICACPDSPPMKGLFVCECAESSRCSRKTLSVCVWGGGEMYLLLVRGVSRSKTLIPLILSQSGWMLFITTINNHSPNTYRYRFKLFM